MKTVCPHCGKNFSLTMEVGGAGIEPPVGGDVVLCIRCGELSVAAEADLRQPTALEHVVFASNRELVRLRRAWRQIVDEMGAVR